MATEPVGKAFLLSITIAFAFEEKLLFGKPPSIWLLEGPFDVGAVLPRVQVDISEGRVIQGLCAIRDKHRLVELDTDQPRFISNAYSGHRRDGRWWLLHLCELLLESIGLKTQPSCSREGDSGQDDRHLHGVLGDLALFLKPQGHLVGALLGFISLN